MTATEKPRVRQYVTCWGCSEEKRHEGAGLCRPCHVRWDNAGRPDTGPPPPLSRAEVSRLGVEGRQRRRAERIEDYADLASWGVKDEQAAERLGVCLWTVEQYRYFLRDGAVQLRFPVDTDLAEAS